MPTPLSLSAPPPHTSPPPAPRRLSRNASLALAVVALHVGGLYALQSGLLRRAAEVLVPVEVLAQIIEPAPQPVAPPVPPAPQPPTPPKPQTVAPKPPPAPTPPPPSTPTPAPRPAPLPTPPMPLATPTAEPSPRAVTGTTAPPSPAPALATPVSAAAPAAPAPIVAPSPAPQPAPRIQLPDSNADYLANRAPPYPSLSKRLGEQGKVVIRVFIDTAGNATQAEVRSSSGYDRLDQTALKTVQTWKYVPGKVNGEPKAMWFNVPIHFVLE